ncbi:MAG: RNA polymerase sigma factor [Candidatus Gastranaerophilaceae bacterium]|nr:sigma-70 family RNA polymerase sigma factor [Christensenellales bacterium]
MEAYEKLVFTVCYRLVGNYHDAQNLTQDTFIAAFNHIGEMDGTNIKGWLVRIASNKSKDLLKSAYYRRVSIMEDISELDILREEMSPERILIEGETGEIIRQSIVSLPEPYHDVAVLFFLEEISVEAIATRLSRPKKTVQSQLYRAKLKLRDELREVLRL